MEKKTKNKGLKINPISFSELLAGKVWDGSKTMTRRLVKDGVPLGNWEETVKFCPYQVGQLLYVREPHYAYGEWQRNGKTKGGDKAWKFHADESEIVLFEKPEKKLRGYYDTRIGYYKRLARFMPKRYARTFLKVTEVRCERLCDISEADAIAEGVEMVASTKGLLALYRQYGTNDTTFEPIQSFLSLWDFINHKKDAPKFADNPWVWVVSFERVVMPNPWNNEQEFDWGWVVDGEGAMAVPKIYGEKLLHVALHVNLATDYKLSGTGYKYSCCACFHYPWMIFDNGGGKSNDIESAKRYAEDAARKFIANGYQLSRP